MTEVAGSVFPYGLGNLDREVNESPRPTRASSTIPIEMPLSKTINPHQLQGNSSEATSGRLWSCWAVPRRECV